MSSSKILIVFFKASNKLIHREASNKLFHREASNRLILR